MSEARSGESAIQATGWLLAIAGAILWVPLVLHILGGDVVFLRDLGFLSGPSGGLFGWILAIAVATLFSVFTVLKVPLVEEHWRRLSWLKVLTVPAAVGAAIIEEAVFRRMLMDAVADRGGSVILQILVSGILFGLAHGVWGAFTRRLMVALKATVATSLLGLALAVVYVVGGRSLAPVIIAHFVVDMVIQPGILLSAFSGGWTGRAPQIARRPTS